MTFSRGTKRRSAFTLIELLVVISVVVVIMALAIGAYFRVRISQEERAGELTITKVTSAFESQWRAALDDAKDQYNQGQTGVKSAMAMAGNDNRRARVIWLKMKLRQQFPTNFWEVLVWPTTVGMEPNPTMYRELQGINPTPPASLPVDQHMAESAVLLYMTVTQGRRGVSTFNPNNHVGPHALGRITLYGREFPIFVDHMQQPIGFVRWPFLGSPAAVAAASDYNRPPYQQRSNQGQAVDPQDPENTLLNSDWYNTVALRNAFETNVYGAVIPAPTPYNLTPVILSAGRDKQWGINANMSRADGREDDNIYSYRLKGVGRSSN